MFITGIVFLASVIQLLADFLSCRLMLVCVSAIQKRAHESISKLLGSPFLDPSRTAPPWEGERADLGLRGQPTYDRNEVTSPIARFRHPYDAGTGVMPHAISGVMRSVGLFMLLGPRFQVKDSLALMSASRHVGAEISGKPMDGERTRGAEA